MKRRSKTTFAQIHISIPVRLKEDFDDTLGYTESRSKAICNLIETSLNGDGQSVRFASTKTLMVALTARDDIDVTLKALLLHILTK